MPEVFDPTLSSADESAISYAPRPERLEGLRVGLVENTKMNSDVILTRLAERLRERYGMELVHMARKPSSGHSVDEEMIGTFKEKADFVVAGVGD